MYSTYLVRMMNWEKDIEVEVLARDEKEAWAIAQYQNRRFLVTGISLKEV